MGYIGTKPSAVPLTSADIADGIITSAKIADGTIATADLNTGLTVNLGAGAVGTPTLTTSGDTNTGIFFPTADTIAFTEGGTEAMRIDSDGDVGIGTSSPSNILDVSRDTVGGTNIRVTNTNANTSYRASYQIKTGASANVWQMLARNGGFFIGVDGTADYLNIDSSGRLGVNSTAPDTGSVQTILHAGSGTYALACKSSDTSGTIYHIRFLRDTSQAGYLTSTATTVSLNNASDARLKENIQNSNSAIQDLKNMQVRQFDWVDNIDTHRDFGFVAQELINVVPEAVTIGSEELDELGKPKQSWGIDYSHIIPRLVKVCQEQQAIIEQLEATSTSQQTKIEQLEARLTALENI